MAISPRVLQSFIEDSLRLTGEAEDCIAASAREWRAGQLRGTRVQRLFEIVHTLKGTAGMVDGGEGIVDRVHELESVLATTSLEDAARDPRWLPVAYRTMKQVRAAIEEFQTERRPETGAPRADRGLLVERLFRGENRLVWLPVASVKKVLHPEAYQGKTSVLFEGTWLPVLGQGRIGVVVMLKDGCVVLTVTEIHGVVTQAEALERGAQIPGASAAAVAA